MGDRAMLMVPLLLLVACGGSPATADAKANPDSVAKDSSAKVAASGKKAVVVHHRAFDTLAAGGGRPLVREVFQYQGGGSRDPFKPIVQDVAHGPELPDLRLVAILYDSRRPGSSIATFRDIGDNHRYTVSPGQRIGRLAVISINENTVKLREDDFGTSREQVYSLRKPEDDQP
jgi:hypothetical protein